MPKFSDKLQRKPTESVTNLRLHQANLSWTAGGQITPCFAHEVTSFSPVSLSLNCKHAEIIVQDKEGQSQLHKKTTKSKNFIFWKKSTCFFFNPQCKWASTSECYGPFQSYLLSHQSQDSQDSTNISLNGSSLPSIRLPKHLTLQSASRRSQEAGGGHISLQLDCIQKLNSPQKSSAKYLLEAFHRVYSLVLPYLPSVCAKDLWLLLTYSTLVELWRPSLGVTLVGCCVATQDKRMVLGWGK